MKRHLAFGTAAATAVLLVSSVALAQPGRGGGFGSTSALFLLQNDQVAKELELVEDQQTKLRELGEKIRDDMRGMFSDFRDLSDEERREKFSELRETMQTKVNEGLKDILLPQQRDRLDQIRFQMSSRGNSGLTSSTVVEQLGLTEAQVEELRKKAEEVRAEVREKVQKIEEEAREDLLGVLTPEQREKYKKLVGEQFEFQGGQGFGGGGFRSRGGQGGDRSGNRGGGDRGNRPQRPET